MPFKYGHKIEQLACDLTNYREQPGREAYCWVFDPINDQRNFIPRAIPTGRNECADWALSFFETKQQARNRMERLQRKNKKIYQKLGTHIAYGRLDEGSGISDKCNSDGHFNHYEYEENDFSTTFTIVNLSYK